MAAHTIPLSGSAEQFSVALNGTTYILRLMFNGAIEGGWVLDIADANETPILCGLPLHIGQNILEQHDHLAIGGPGSQLILKSDGSGEDPGFDNLTAYTLIFIDGAS
ncbi:phage baseplate plug protein [Methylobacterium sp. J-068]|uniref:phage baseplate plug family protein n=1 Tax=Methylobacterium sp. J-068 TaxID=2836649 RepID=UPI001FB8E3C0|nr:hypothetical protein [Methylobacterium sp. J-068]MCJ2036393.1 hypothetical protein [Methylobacterium sp. J-068]